MRDPMTAEWGGRAAQSARAMMAPNLPCPCARGCGTVLTVDDAWVVGHKKSRHAYPELTWDVRNWQIECRPCSNKSSNEAAVEKALRTLAGSSPSAGAPDTSLRPVSLPEDQDDDLDQPALPGVVVTATEPEPAPTTIRPELLWDPERLAEYPWLTDLVLNVPEDANPPLWMSPPPPNAVGSYGSEAIEWIERVEKKTLRWWQRLAITRQLEHDADGALCAETYIESAPRRAGKSVRMRGLAMWRLADPLDLLDETQLVMHTGNDLATCREIQRGAWRWAEDNWGTKSVTRANGKECVETPHGDRWLTRSQDAVYGYDVCLAMVDEAWDVKPETVADGLEPAMLERIMPQLSITSTAHPRTTSLMPTYLRVALTTDDPTVIIIVWGVDPARLAGLTSEQRAQALADPTMWKAASPHWSEQRAAYIASKWERARAARPTPDNPDPIRTFEKQYLNVWTLDIDTSLPGEPLVSEAAWSALAAPSPAGVPTSAAIESWFNEGLALALGWKDAAGRAVVDVHTFDTLAEAVAAAKATGYRGRYVVGASLVGDPALARLRVDKGQGTATVAVGSLARLVSDDVLRHTGRPDLTVQVLDVRTKPGSNGHAVVSKGRADAVKAAVWAADAARARRSGGVSIIVLDDEDDD